MPLYMCASVAFLIPFGSFLRNQESRPLCICHFVPLLTPMSLQRKQDAWPFCATQLFTPPGSRPLPGDGSSTTLLGSFPHKRELSVSVFTPAIRSRTVPEVKILFGYIFPLDMLWLRFLPQFLDQVGQQGRVIRLDQMQDAGGRHLEFFHGRGCPPPKPPTCLPLGKIQFADDLLQPLEHNGLLVLVVITDDPLLIRRIFSVCHKKTFSYSEGNILRGLRSPLLRRRGWPELRQAG